ncbi:hypothetical protein TBLA_0A07380 [Henningerozyma blattae CBS 6284]|uniref:Uncharacterized protein n=1 Tax=Henningerozyma blattae (strain ATCC 34711 / CBS 6284 / DSM 70876 / NBRC 10599 / NRRL Y-10934 / UCD 77-7) TaxID=1071380 RepID=I2GWM6_HENB6|nr:hypothetical protein TBLA_0A07380 [Tetrapisispora blattae CBS 6284]CCH58528.1 hypothetical protein TBLA_0A07380 [Tetrapisispora blattae CBS 6284]
MSGQFDKTQLTKILIGALRDLGYNDSAITLQDESGGIKVESTIVQNFFNIINKKNNQFLKVSFFEIASLPLRYGCLKDDLPAESKDIGKEITINDWDTLVEFMSLQTKYIMDVLQNSFKRSTCSTDTLIRWCTVLKIFYLINQQIFFEIIFIHENPIKAITFLKSILRRLLLVWESTLYDINFTTSSPNDDEETVILDPNVNLGFTDFISIPKHLPTEIDYNFTNTYNSVSFNNNELNEIQFDRVNSDEIIRKLTALLTDPNQYYQLPVWRNHFIDSRIFLINEISKLINPDDLIPKNRLIELLNQSIKYQKSKDVFNISDSDSDDMTQQTSSYSQDSCTQISKNHDLSFEREFEYELDSNNTNTAVDDSTLVSTAASSVGSTIVSNSNSKFNTKRTTYNLLQNNVPTTKSLDFKKIYTISENTDEIWYLQFSPNGKYLASASSDTLTDKKILIYDVEDNFKVYKVLAGNDQCVLYLSFSPDSRYIVSCPFNEMANVYDIHSSGEKFLCNELFPNSSYSDANEKYYTQVLNPISSFQITKLRPQNINQNQPMLDGHHPLPGSPSLPTINNNNVGATHNANSNSNCPRIWSCDWLHSPIGKYVLAVGSPDREVVFYNIKKKKIIFRMNSFMGTSNPIIDSITGKREVFPRIHDLKVTFDDRYLILMSNQGIIDTYSLKDLLQSLEIEANNLSSSSSSSSPSPTPITSWNGGNNNNNGNHRNSIGLPKINLTRISRLMIQKKTTSITLPEMKSANDPLASKVLINLQSNEIQLWDFKQQILIQKYFGQKQEQFIIRSCLGYNNKLVASGSEDGRIYIWFRKHGNILHVIPAHVCESSRPATSQNSILLNQEDFPIISHRSKEAASKKKKREKNCNVVVWNPANKTMFASGGDDGFIHIWKVERS